MAHLGILGEYRFSDSEEAGADIRGASVYGTGDDKLGKIDDVIFDHASADIKYVVIDTGGWLSSKKFVVPADRLRMSAKHDNEFEVALDIAGFDRSDADLGADFIAQAVGNSAHRKFRAGVDSRAR